MSRDPIGELGGGHLFCFVKNKATVNRDALGLTVENDLVEELGGVTDGVYDARYGTVPRAGDPGKSDGATWLVLHAFYICEFCEPYKEGCRVLNLRKDTWITGFVMWRKSKEGRKLKSKRTVEQHENLHRDYAYAAADAFDAALHSTIDKACVTKNCCDAKVAYLRAVKEFHEAVSDVNDAQLELDDYDMEDPIAGSQNEYNDLIAARKARNAKTNKLDTAAATVLNQCSTTAQPSAGRAKK